MKNRLWASSLLFPFALALTGPLFAQNDHYPQFMEMGNQAYASQKLELAMDYYKSALDDNPDCWQAYVGLGNCYYYQKKWKDSLAAYEKALKMQPTNEELVKFVQFLRKKVAPAPLPTPTPLPSAPGLPGLPPLPLPGGPAPK